MPSPLKPFDDVFPEHWISERPSLVYPLSKNQPYREEVTRWLAFFQQKGWLQAPVVTRLQSARSWASFYSKINEFRAGYFFETKLGVELQIYEAHTVSDHTVEFEGAYEGRKLFVEVKHHSTW